MDKQPTIVFMDLSGSSAAYEALGNERVAEVVSRLTRWIGGVCETHGGQIVKFLGDGVLARFPSGSRAVSAAISAQRGYADQIKREPRALRMGLKVGMASGAVVEMNADAYGDSVNLAARLADMAGPGAIWADELVLVHVHGVSPPPVPATGDEGATVIAETAVRSRALGKISVPGLTQLRSVFQIFWRDDPAFEQMTAPGGLDLMSAAQRDSSSRITLRWLDATKAFTAGSQSIRVGRAAGSDFVVSDPRVSRQHIQIEWVQGAFVLTDVSSFGTWVRFAETQGTEVALRRTQCPLLSSGEIALGAPFEDISAPVLTFHVREAPAGAGRQNLLQLTGF